jgi:hypothetical protein
LVRRLTNPLCIDANGRPVSPQPGAATAECPAGAKREFNSVQDLHIGVVSSNLGSHGAAGGCGPGGYTDDRGRLVSRGVQTTYNSLGFLAWDPAGTKQPPGENDPERLDSDVRDLVLGVDEVGCAAEAPLEAMYRFLIDPEPYLSLELEPCATPAGRCVVKRGVDETLLTQRQDFLRPDSLVAVLLLSDENDCSVVDGGDAWRVLSPEPMARGTSACQFDPSDTCCRPCDAGNTPTGCLPAAVDPECMKGPHPPEEDSFYLRCWAQKRRFGREFLQPISRYVDGLLGRPVPRRDDSLVDNPLYLGQDGTQRHPSLVYFAALVGVPWQDLAVDPTDPERLVYKTAAELRDQGVWDVIASDPLMIESIVERSGTNPVTGDALAPSTATSPRENPINGHEMVLSAGGFDLQFACIFELPEPRDCSSSPFWCDCGQNASGARKPICQDDSGNYGTTQFFAKAFPGLRQLAVLRGIGDNAIAASICARNMTEPSRQDYGYRPALAALVDRLRDGLF